MMVAGKDSSRWRRHMARLIISSFKSVRVIMALQIIRPHRCHCDHTIQNVITVYPHTRYSLPFVCDSFPKQPGPTTQTRN